jgi:hypothetical protein
MSVAVRIEINSLRWLGFGNFEANEGGSMYGCRAGGRTDAWDCRLEVARDLFIKYPRRHRSSCPARFSSSSA